MRIAAQLGVATPLLLSLSLGCFSAVARGDFRRGGLIASSRRAQFHGRDAVARPAGGAAAFGVDRVVAVALPRPLELKEQDDYKLALAFDHDRHLWGGSHRRRSQLEGAPAFVAERQGARVRSKRIRNGFFRTRQKTKVFFDFERDFDASRRASDSARGTTRGEATSSSSRRRGSRCRPLA